jgi:glycosyltransferase involved in cell wall biosynthesis
MSHICIITCTKDRPKEIKCLLESISSQTVKPNLHIIVDGSDNPVPVKSVIDQFAHLPIKYVTLRPPGLTRQKNYGISLLPENSEWIGILDDDVVLASDTIENLQKYLTKDKEVKGIGLVFSNVPVRGKSFWRNILLTDGNRDGSFTLSGVPNSIHNFNGIIKTEWLYGGATFWHHSILQEFNFDEWYSGVGYFEDIDFSYRVSRKYPTIFMSNALCEVADNLIPTEKLSKVGTWQIVAWWYFTTKSKAFNKFFVIYSMLAVTLTNTFIGIFRPSSRRIHNAFGNLKGLIVVFTGKTMSHKGFQK